MRFILLIIALLSASPAFAGPWVRAEGEGFLSFAIEGPTSDDSAFGTVFVEYGLSDRITLGFDMGGTDEDLHKAILFAKMPVKLPEFLSFKAAADLGFGVREDMKVIRSGLSIGRGFEFVGMPGWMSVDSIAYIETKGRDLAIATDLTIGLNTTERSKWIVQLQNGYEQSKEDYMKIAPSYIYERKPGQHLEIGVLAGLRNAEDYALKLGLWQTF